MAKPCAWCKSTEHIGADCPKWEPGLNVFGIRKIEALKARVALLEEVAAAAREGAAFLRSRAGAGQNYPHIHMRDVAEMLESALQKLDDSKGSHGRGR